MKNIYKLLPILLIAVLISCDKNKATPLTAGEKIQGTWNLTSVSRDGADVSSEFSGFSVKISDSNYTITNGGTAFKDTSGSISNFDTGSTASSFQVTFASSTQFNVTMELSNENKTLTLRFDIDKSTFEGGRESGLAGSYVFVVNK